MAELARYPLLQGLPDDYQAGISPQPDGRLEFRVPGTAMFVPHLPPTLSRRLNRVMVEPGKVLRTSPANYGHPVVNYVADADLCSQTLQSIERFVQELGSPCFNHPTAVRMSARHHVSSRLSALPELVMPRTELVSATDAADFARQIEGLGMKYPLIVRVPGTHASTATQLAKEASELPRALYALPVAGRPLYATEFVDCRDADGLYRKLRIVVVGNQVFARHYLSASDWNVHADDRLSAGRDIEKRILDAFPNSFSMDLQAIALQVADIVELDYFGIDCCPRPDGRVLVFEVNAAMDILHDSSPDEPYWAPRLAIVRNALAELIVDPTRWRHQGSKGTGS